MKVTIVALGKYADIFDHFRKRIDQFVPTDIRRILVRDGDAITDAPGWEILEGSTPFSMAANLNIGWRAVESDSDILNLNDDVYFLESDPIAKFQQLVYSEPRIGCVSAYPKVGLFGSMEQQRPFADRSLTFLKTATNTCLYVRCECLDEVGLYDETFTDAYGCEDVDFTYRVNLAGWKVAVARDIPCEHGYGRARWGSTANRARPGSAGLNPVAMERFRNKHGHFDISGYWNWNT
jgi:hypothetical protein